MFNAVYIIVMLVIAALFGAAVGVFFYRKWLPYKQRFEAKENERRRIIERRIIAMRLVAKRDALLSRTKGRKDN